jgi:hypothetical protein
VGKSALIQHQRNAHAKPFKRATKALRRLRTILGRVIRDITPKIAAQPELAEVFALPLSLARRVKDQRQRERGCDLYSLHAPEVECIGNGKAHRPYGFGVKVSVGTPLYRCKAGQFVAHVQALSDIPWLTSFLIPSRRLGLRSSGSSRVRDNAATIRPRRGACGSTWRARSEICSCNQAGVQEATIRSGAGVGHLKAPAPHGWLRHPVSGPDPREGDDDDADDRTDWRWSWPGWAHVAAAQA